jgi:uncharacterized protein with NRDE domain
MCTLAVAVRPAPGVPLWVAANRDEALARPSTGPEAWPGPPRLLAPRDVQAGGTWLGLNAHGLFVGVTNRFAAPHHPHRASRGHLVLEALRAPSAAALHASLAALPPDRHNAFHLLYADRHSAHVTWSDGERLTRADLEPGLHVLSERSFAGAEAPRDAWVREAWAEGRGAGGEPDAGALMRLLGTHAPEGVAPLDRPCVHLPGVPYGTRSSLVLRLGAGWEDTRLWWAEGPPCTAPFRDLSPRVREALGAPAP